MLMDLYQHFIVHICVKTIFKNRNMKKTSLQVSITDEHSDQFDDREYYL